MSLAKQPFWLDGGYDSLSVEACPKAPDHDWWEFRLGDVLEHPHNPDERMCICRSCYVPRCGHVEYTEKGKVKRTEDPCILPRHHDGNHLPLSEKPEPIPDTIPEG